MLAAALPSAAAPVTNLGVGSSAVADTADASGFGAVRSGSVPTQRDRRSQSPYAFATGRATPPTPAPPQYPSILDTGILGLADTVTRTVGSHPTPRGAARAEAHSAAGSGTGILGLRDADHVTPTAATPGSSASASQPGIGDGASTRFQDRWVQDHLASASPNASANGNYAGDPLSGIIGGAASPFQDLWPQGQLAAETSAPEPDDPSVFRFSAASQQMNAAIDQLVRDNGLTPFHRLGNRLHHLSEQIAAGDLTRADAEADFARYSGELQEEREALARLTPGSDLSGQGGASDPSSAGSLLPRPRGAAQAEAFQTQAIPRGAARAEAFERLPAAADRDPLDQSVAEPYFFERHGYDPRLGPHVFVPLDFPDPLVQAITDEWWDEMQALEEPPNGDRYPVDHPNRHSYVTYTPACREEDCPTEQVFEALLPNAAPGQTGPAVTGNDVEIHVTPFNKGLGQVRQRVYEDTLSITNYTIPGRHSFDPGYVTRSVVVIDGIVYVRTISEGIGPDSWTNVTGALDQQWGWPAIDDAILTDLSDQGVRLLTPRERLQAAIGPHLTLPRYYENVIPPVHDLFNNVR